MGQPAGTGHQTATAAAAVSLAHQIEAGWPEEESGLEPSMTEIAERFGYDFARLSDIAEEAETRFEALDKLS